ncbi:hypothetical protein HPB47_022749 [Ixodes persulcatus]|uniref:Uncharacterized protein n=1 Tax=Ixodes persulcatus TaxID=34615 RepID=A0AC60Q919_IXOPE|nr:hypothetical protein HPB47_022749 [Ixodes persulcatus]
MMDHIAEGGDVFMDVLGKFADQGKEINMLKPFQGLTMDYIGRAAFGIDTSFQNDLNNPFFIMAQRTLKEVMIGPFHMLARVRKTRALSSEEVIMNSTILFVGGFDTSATTLCFITYALGKYPDVQEKVRQEVNEVLNEGGSLDYETVTKKLKYVIQVINEALRMWPPGLTFTTRQAKEDFEYQGIKYKAGTCIMSPVAVIHMDERFFPDPTKFDPDRFSEENEGSIPKLAFQPFGMGPRNCLGLRLAYLDLAYTVARMAQNFRWELGESQKASTSRKITLNHSTLLLFWPTSRPDLNSTNTKLEPNVCRERRLKFGAKERRPLRQSLLGVLRQLRLYVSHDTFNVRL